MYLEIVPRTICYLLWRFFFWGEHLDGTFDNVRFCGLRLMIGPLLEVLGQCAILVSLDKGLCHKMIQPRVNPYELFGRHV